MKFGRKSKPYRVRGTRRLSPGCSLLVLGLFMLVIYFFFAPWNVIKGFGEPFSFLPDALGWAKRVTPDEVHRFILPDEPAAIENLEPGRYIVFVSGWFNLSGQSTVMVSSEDVVGETRPYRHVRYYDPIHVNGVPQAFFETFNQGTVQITVEPAPGTNLPSSYELAVIPDYTSGNESIIHAMTVLQLALLLILVAVTYFVFFRDKQERVYKEHNDSQERKRRDMDDFLKDL
ncbi:MAG: hypothetical protein M9928_19630 [Anaerolineae bacterium]|nr:hypothetical protein [Anaerolineae bacterium]MCO5196495.1 hypothetical protein [Anaerolineae bacterium]MCO5207226.1 hypothetical protein [Anaerolineae bacterium]